MRTSARSAALFLGLLVSVSLLCNGQAKLDPRAAKPTNEVYEVLSQLRGKVLVDGDGKDADWQSLPWKPINQLWLGPELKGRDFMGRYKLAWAKEGLYLLAETIDDTLVDTHADPLVKYWDDDCLEVFVDENANGGNHQYNHSAFAYHISLAGQNIDIGPDMVARNYKAHIISVRKTVKQKSTWECLIRLYPETFKDDTPGQPSVNLGKDKKIGFMLAYCDNDKSEERENFIGSIPIAGQEKNVGWINASVFGKYVLMGN